ncbi:MFS transporter [Pseudarthrobacter raffinosi]|uniref:MFS transporter n=1 Tax=Pseudarthrobacter raffinosi TaxID=2953651 RepID=UPI00208F7BE0|nr:MULTISPECIES: MFS transporter [unclassified Pseudarthrobacter]MCO4236921.1 MFS transporter [Pseudarthrobacter sp. MDT3-28]MCO4250637.1 MFS transporter [Pseudarthrobacter sp. MDT3-9]
MTNKPRPGLAIAALSLGTSLNPLNSSMIAVALVVLREDFALDVATVTWVITSFYLASAAGQPLMGRLADRFGPRRLFTFGMALVAVTCALAPFAPNFALVCVARALMAVGTATAYPSAVVMVTELSRLAKLPSTRPLGRIQMANTSAAAVGPVVGGLLVSLLGWQALFAVNVPLALLALIVVHRAAPADAGRETGKLSTLIRDSDIPGILAFVASLMLAMMALLNVMPGYRWWLLGAATVIAALFAWRELRFRPPFLDLRLLGRNRPLLLVYLVFVVFSGVYYFAFFGLPQLLQEAGHYDAGLVGLLMLPLAAMSVLVTPVTVRLIERFGVRSVLIAGALILLVASGGLGALTVSLWPPLVFVLTALMGVPYGVVSTASNQGLYVSARPEERGVAAGIFQTCRYLGAITATVLIGVLYGPGVNQSNWGLMVLVMLGLGAVVLALAVAWQRKGA